MKMTPSIKKLLSIGSGRLCPGQRPSASVPTELRDMLDEANGFYAFESALHVFPSGGDAAHLGVEAWNSPDLWRFEYGDMVEGCWFFAEDAFGVQFCLKEGHVGSFNPETGEIEPLAKTVEEWAEKVLKEYDCLTGHPLAHAWQERHGALKPGTRLVPKVPFVCGGKFNLDNLVAIDAVKGMRARGNLARQIRDLPDGAQIQFTISE
jgi:hypothetical protein